MSLWRGMANRSHCQIEAEERLLCTFRRILLLDTSRVCGASAVFGLSTPAGTVHVPRFGLPTAETIHTKKKPKMNAHGARAAESIHSGLAPTAPRLGINYPFSLLAVSAFKTWKVTGWQDKSLNGPDLID